MCCYLSTDVRFKYSIKFLTCLSQSLMSPINTPSMMGDGDECLQICVVITSCIVPFSKEHWINIGTLKTTSAINRNGFIEMVNVSN